MCANEMDWRMGFAPLGATEREGWRRLARGEAHRFMCEAGG